MTTIDTSTEAVEALFEALLDDAHDDYSLVKNELTQTQLDRIAAARDLVPALLKERDEARAALAASQPADPVTNAGCRQPVKVKPLVWRRDNLKGSYPARFRAEMPCKSGDYTLAGSERENLWQWFRNGYFVVGHQMHKPMPLEAAKAAAQADYDARILSALEWKMTVSPEVQALVDDGRPCVSDLFLVALFDQINDVHDREYFIKAWLEGDWECATSEITIGAAK